MRKSPAPAVVCPYGRGISLWRWWLSPVALGCGTGERAVIGGLRSTAWLFPPACSSMDLVLPGLAPVVCGARWGSLTEPGWFG